MYTLDLVLHVLCLMCMLATISPMPHPTPLQQTYTRESAIVRIVEGSIRYSYTTTYLEFKWQVVYGTPDTLDLLYKTKGSPQWQIMLSNLDPSIGSYAGKTNVTLEWMTYEFKLEESAETSGPGKVNNDDLYVWDPAGQDNKDVEDDDDQFAFRIAFPTIGFVMFLVGVGFTCNSIRLHHNDKDEAKKKLKELKDSTYRHSLHSIYEEPEDSEDPEEGLDEDPEEGPAGVSTEEAEDPEEEAENPTEVEDISHRKKTRRNYRDRSHDATQVLTHGGRVDAVEKDIKLRELLESYSLQ